MVCGNRHGCTMAVLKGMLCRCTLVLCGRPTRAPCASQRPCFPSNRRHPFGQATEVQYGYMRPFRSIPIFVTCAYRPHAVRPLHAIRRRGRAAGGRATPHRPRACTKTWFRVPFSARFSSPELDPCPSLYQKWSTHRDVIAMQCQDVPTTRHDWELHGDRSIR